MNYGTLVASALCLGAFCNNEVTVWSHESVTIYQTPELRRLDPIQYGNYPPVDFGKTQGQIIVSPSPLPPVVVVLPPREMTGDEYVGIAHKWKLEAEQWRRDHPDD